jgi:hypothetical protein
MMILKEGTGWVKWAKKLAKEQTRSECAEFKEGYVSKQSPSIKTALD